MEEEILIKETPGCEKGIWIVPEINYVHEDPIGFKPWTKNITYCGYTATLPNGSTVNIRMYLNLSGVFDYGSYTAFLMNMYLTNG